MASPGSGERSKKIRAMFLLARFSPREYSRRFEQTLVNGAPEGDDPADHFFCRLEHHDLLAGGQRDDRIRGDFNVFDQIRVQYQRDMVQARELDHEWSRPLIYRQLRCETLGDGGRVSAGEMLAISPGTARRA